MNLFLEYPPNPANPALLELAKELKKLPHPADDPSVVSRKAVIDLLDSTNKGIEDLWKSVCDEIAKELTNLSEDISTSTKCLTTKVTDLTTQVADLKGQLSSLSAQALKFSTNYSLPIGVAGALAIVIAFCGLQLSNEKDKTKRYLFTSVGIVGFAGMCFALFSTPAAAAFLARFAITK